MVAGKVKTAIGLQQPPPNANPKPNPSSKPPLLPPPSSANKQNQHQKGSTRPFGAYFPRSSAQVQPRPPDVAELLQLVEESRERESRLKNELLEQKLLKHSVAIVPVLENEISNKDSEIERSRKKIECLEAENERLRNENEYLHMELSKQNQKYDEKIRQMQAELADIKVSVMEREREEEEDASSSSSSSSTIPKFIDITSVRSYKSGITANYLRKCSTQSNNVVGNFWKNETEVKKEEFVGAVESTERHMYSPCNSEEMLESSVGSMGIGSRAPRVPKPPPMPSAAFISSISSSASLPSYGSVHDSADRALAGNTNVSAPVKSANPPQSKAVSPPPPPPPPPLKGSKQGKVRRVPEVVEFYHSLMRRDSNCRRDAGAADLQAAGVTAKDMIGEIENRSAHLLAIKTDVETHGDLIRFLIKEVEGAAFTDIEDVVPFVKWLDDELSYLVDERAVLKHFDWPEQKADTLREAAFGYCDLKKLESEASLFRDDPKQPFGPALKKMQSLFEKLEHGVYNLSRIRESAAKRYKVFRIPSNWMLDTGFVSQIKLASVKLALKYMKRVLLELEMVGGGGGPEEEELIVQGVKFAFRVHQFAGGFDVETMKVFQELKDKSQMCNVQYQNQHQHKLVCRSSAAC